MTTRASTELLRDFGPGAAAAILLIGGGAMAVRFILNARTTPAPRKVMQFTVVNVQPPAVRPPPPPPPVQQPKEVEPVRTRVDLKPTDFVPPEASHAPAGGGGRLSLAAEGQGAGDAFNLAGNPGGKGLLSGGGLGDGSGDGEGVGGGGPGERYGWYYTQVSEQLEVLLRRSKALTALSARLEVRVWVDANRRIKVEPLKPEQDPRVLDALHALDGATVRDLPPEGTPIPMILRISARRPQ
jgi:hypothetical protein